MEIYQREREGILILGMAGHLILGPDNLRFRTAAQSCLAAGNSRIILDCTRLRSIDSAGLDELVLFQAELQRAGGRVVLLEITQTRMELHVVAKLEVIFDVFKDAQEAVNSFFAHRAIHHFDILQFVREETGPTNLSPAAVVSARQSSAEHLSEPGAGVGGE